MGSFLSRAFVERYHKDIVGAVFCGTSGPNPAAAAGILIANAVVLFRGSRHYSQLLDKAAFGFYNDKYPGKPRTPFDWLNSDPTEVDKYIADENCGFLFTAAGYLDLFKLLKHVSRAKWFDEIPYNFPILLVAGDQDPVGDFGKGVRLIAKRLRESGNKGRTGRTECVLFEGMRHEILLEPNRQLVYDAVLRWMNQILETNLS
jgi:alpha-beta hydrolase superfamily lysophospholipase